MNYQNDNHKEEVRENSGNIKKICFLAAGGILASALLIGGIGLAGCHGKQETVKETVNSQTVQPDNSITNEVKEELTSISEYLTQLDTQIMNNQSELDKVIGSNAEVGEQTVVELEKIQNHYKDLYSKMSNYEQKFLHYVENDADVTEGTNTGIVTLHTTLAETKEKLVETEERITNTLQMIESGQATRQEKLLEQLTTVKDHISETEKLIEKVEMSTQDVLKEMEKEISGQHTEVIGTLEKMQSDLSGEIAEDMEEIGKSLSGLDSSLTNTVTEKTDALKVQMETTLSEIRTEFLQVDESLKKADDTFLAFWGDYAEDIEKSNIRLNDIDDALVRAGVQLSETKEQLADLLTEMENADSIRQEETEKKLTDLQTAMEETKEYVRLAEEQIGKTLDSMNEQQKADQEELVTTLTDIKDTILQNVEAGISGLTGEMQTMREETGKEFDKLEQTLAVQKAEMEAALEEKTSEIRELTGAALTELKGEFAKAEEEFNAYEKTFESFAAEYRADAEAAGVKLDEIGTSIDSAKEQLVSTEQKLNDTLSEMEANAELRYEELSGKTADILNAVSDAKEQVKVVGDQIAQILNGMSEQQKADHTELVKMLEGIGVGTEQTFEKIDSGFETLQTGMDAGFASLQENMDVSVNSLRSQMDDIHTKITDTQTEIKGILTGMEEKSVEQYEEMMEAIEEAVGDINSDVSNAHNNLQALIRMLNADMAENHRDTLDTLENMETSMSDFLSQNMEEINASFSNLNSELSDYFSQVQAGQGNLGAAVDELDTTMGNLGTELKTVLQTVLDAISAHDTANKEGQSSILNILSDHDSKSEMSHAGIESKIDTHNAAMMSYLDAFKNEVNQNLEQVFQSVSNGKKLVVSALLTKGVSIESDATFTDIYQKILDIPQEIVVGEQQLPGTISYEYHYHEDGNGTLTHDTTSKVPGGCYSDAKHQDYEVIGTHEEVRTGSTQTTGACGCGYTDYFLTSTPCPGCGHHHWGQGCTQEVTKTINYTYTVPVDDYGWVEKDYYDLICGLSDGQIIGATILYDSAAVSPASVMRMARPVVGETGDEIVVGPDGLPEGAVIIEEIIVTEENEQEKENEIPEETETSGTSEEAEVPVQPEMGVDTVSGNTAGSGKDIVLEETENVTEEVVEPELSETITEETESFEADNEEIESSQN